MLHQDIGRGFVGNHLFIKQDESFMMTVLKLHNDDVIIVPCVCVV